MSRRFEAGDRVLLVDNKRRRHLITLAPGGQFHTHAGIVEHDAIIGADEGLTVRTTKGARLVAVRPTLAEYVLEMPRGPEPWGRRLEGRNHVREGLASRFAGLPDVHYGDDRHGVSGNRGCSEWLLTGTALDGERIEVRGCDLFEFEGSKIVRKDSYWKIVEG